MDESAFGADVLSFAFRNNMCAIGGVPLGANRKGGDIPRAGTVFGIDDFGHPQLLGQARFNAA
jgi:hypothetical protein